MRPERQQAETRALYLECARGLKRAGAKDYEIAEILEVSGTYGAVPTGGVDPMTLAEAISVIDVLAESGDDRERDAWEQIRSLLTQPLWAPASSVRLDRVAWGDGNAEHDE